MTAFGLFWCAQAASRFGDPITVIALASLTYRATHSALYTAVAVVIATLPAAIFGFVGGAIGDAVGPRRAMILCDLIRAITIALIPFVLESSYGVIGAYACVFAAGLAAAVFNPARIAAIPQLVPPERVGEANARIAATDRTVEVLGSLAAGLLVPLVAEGAFFIDALTFVCSAILLSAIRTPEARSGISFGRLLAETGVGLRFLAASPILRPNTVFSLVAQLALPVVNGLTPVLLIRRFAGGDAALGAALFGTSEASLASGAIMAGLVLPEYLPRLRKGQLLVAGFATYGFLLVLLGFSPSFLPAVVIFFCIGAANVVFLVPNITLSVEATPPNMRARVAGARLALLNLTWLPLVAVSGGLADAVDAGILISLAGTITLVTAIVGSQIPAIRDVP